MKNSKVSICIPTYNGEKFIRKTINSILNQTYKNYEIIIVDDCSKDNTVKIIKEEYKEYKIRIIENLNNISMVENWNKCFEYATGDYILFLFQDDILNGKCLEKKVDLLDKNDYVVFAYSATSIIDKNDNKRMIRRYFNKDTIIDGEKLIKKSFSFSKNIFGEPSNILFRKNILKKIDGYCTSLSYTPDLEFCLRMSKFGKVGYINEDLMSFRISNGSMTTRIFNNLKNVIKDDEKFIIEVKKYNKNIKSIDVLIHRIMTRIRCCMRMIYMFFIK